MRLARALVASILLALGWPAVAGAAETEPTPLFRFADAAITESSGLAVSSYDDRILFTHNDSGDRARFFAVDEQSGATLATYRVPGAANVDWEDMAAAPDASGRSAPSRPEAARWCCGPMPRPSPGRWDPAVYRPR